MDMLQATADPNDLIRRVSDMIDAGRTGAARPLLAAARRSIPPSPGLSQLSARLAMRDGALEQARIELDEAVEISPPSIQACGRSAPTCASGWATWKGQPAMPPKLSSSTAETPTRRLFSAP